MKKADYWKKGLPYVGSKWQKASAIIESLPAGGRFIDVFGGGGAITLEAADSHKWSDVVYNDRRSSVVHLLEALIKDDPHINLDRYTWINRRAFNYWRDHKPDSMERTLILLCWSFSNDERSYCWGRTKEDLKLDLVDEYLVHGDKTLNIDGRYQVYKDKFKNQLEPISRLLRIERLQAIENLKRMENIQNISKDLNITFSTNDFVKLQIRSNDLVYCDPPYINTKHQYGGFDSDRFISWLKALPTDKIYISEQSVLPYTKIYKKLGKKTAFTANGSRKEELLLEFIK